MTSPKRTAPRTPERLAPLAARPPTRIFSTARREPWDRPARCRVRLEPLARGRREPDETARRALTLAFTRPFIKQQLDYPRALGDDRGAARFPRSPTVARLQRARSDVAHEWYQPPEKRMYQRRTRADIGDSVVTYPRPRNTRTAQEYAYDFDRVLRRYMMRTLEPFLPPGRALELGAIWAMSPSSSPLGYADVTVVEASDELVAKASARLGVRATFVHATFETVSSTSATTRCS